MIPSDAEPLDLDPRLSEDEEDVLFNADAVRARQKHIITLLRGVRALAISIVMLFVVFGVAGVLLVQSMIDTRDLTRGLQHEQHAVLCDLYSRSERPPPSALECP
jgi:hypothetical protein